VVEQHQIGAGRGQNAFDLFQLSLSDEGCGIGTRTALDESGRDLGSGAAGQFFKFG